MIRKASAQIAARQMPAPLHHAEHAWDYFTRTNTLTRDMSVNRTSLAKVIATLQEAGLLPVAAPTASAFYVDDRYLREARGS